MEQYIIKYFRLTLGYGRLSKGVKSQIDIEPCKVRALCREVKNISSLGRGSEGFSVVANMFKWKPKTKIIDKT